MSKPVSTADRSLTRGSAFSSGIGSIIVLVVVLIGRSTAADDRPSNEVLMKGADLFAREWLPGNSNGARGDGLGPMYNETSCIACHYQGGPGGSGPTSANVEIMTANPRGQKEAELHPGFRTARSIVLHRYGVDPMYKAWRLRLVATDRVADMAESVDTEIKQVQELIQPLSPRFAAQGGRFAGNGVVFSQRSAPALFGAGLIDTISDETLLAAEKSRYPGFPEIQGRANRLKDGRLGRFGWKAESSSLQKFVLLACANELGLEVPGHHQAPSPLEPDAKAKDLDLTREDCDALVAFVRHLPPPTSRKPAGSLESPSVAAGRTLFTAAGCATCHRPRLGDIEGIYSDLLLHDMGPALADSGRSYGIIEPGNTSDGTKDQEWRTPPLWGFRDSGPYVHDGRAKNLEEAVALHGGQAANSARRFFKLLPEERLRIQAFLRSLAPLAGAAR